MPAARRPDPAAWGIEPDYEAVGGERIATPPDTVAALLAAMRAEGPCPPDASARVRVHTAGVPLRLPAPHAIEDERGTIVAGAATAVPADLPIGYYALHRHERRHEGATPTRLILAPRTCFLPEELRGWAWVAQLYAVRSTGSWGMGDLADLRRLGAWARDLGATTVLLNPLHAPLPLLPQEASPYFPSSRLYRNPLYLRVEDVLGAAAIGPELDALAAAGRARNEARRIDRDAIFRLKLVALERIFDATASRHEADLHAYETREGAPLRDFSAFCALCERHGPPWSAWPAPLRHPASAARLVAADADLERRARFHRWTQWQLDVQLARASEALPPLHDLAVGVDPGGADAWMFQDQLADGVTIGAPPDPFAPGGQDWAVRAFDPWRLRAHGYEPFVRTLRAAFRHGMGLRIDHVMGLFRLFWVPAGAGPARGGYVRSPSADLLAVLALESHRAGAIVVGEDLGTVEPGVREELARRRILSYRLLLFEDRPPSAYPVDALAALTTHDLPTLAGICDGAGGAAGREIRDRVCRFGGVRPGATAEEAAAEAYGALAAGPSRLVAATLEDALAAREQPNHPGTIDPRNWSIPLPEPLEALTADPRPARLAAVLRRRPATPRPC